MTKPLRHRKALLRAYPLRTGVVDELPSLPPVCAPGYGPCRSLQAAESLAQVSLTARPPQLKWRPHIRLGRESAMNARTLPEWQRKRAKHGEATSAPATAVASVDANADADADADVSTEGSRTPVGDTSNNELVPAADVHPVLRELRHHIKKSDCAETVALSSSPGGLDDAAMATLSEALRHNHNITSLQLDNNGITSRGVQLLCDALQQSGNRSLTALNLSSNALGDEGAAAFATLLDANRMAASDLDEYEVYDKSSCADGDGECDDGNGVDEVGEAEAGEVEHTSVDVRPRVRGRGLQYLSLQFNGIGDHGAHALGAALARASASVQDEEASSEIDVNIARTQTQAQARLCCRLRKLWLGGNEIGDNGLRALLHGVEHSKRLAVLNAAMNPGMAALRRQVEQEAALHAEEQAAFLEEKRAAARAEAAANSVVVAAKPTGPYAHLGPGVVYVPAANSDDEDDDSGGGALGEGADWADLAPGRRWLRRASAASMHGTQRFEVRPIEASPPRLTLLQQQDTRRADLREAGLVAIAAEGRRIGSSQEWSEEHRTVALEHFLRGVPGSPSLRGGRTERVWKNGASPASKWLPDAAPLSLNRTMRERAAAAAAMQHDAQVAARVAKYEKWKYERDEMERLAREEAERMVEEERRLREEEERKRREAAATKRRLEESRRRAEEERRRKEEEARLAKEEAERKQAERVAKRAAAKEQARYQLELRETTIQVRKIRRPFCAVKIQRWYREAIIQLHLRRRKAAHKHRHHHHHHHKHGKGKGKGKGGKSKGKGKKK